MATSTSTSTSTSQRSKIPAASAPGTTVNGAAHSHHALRSWFDRLATWASHWSGRSLTFLVAIAIIVVWALTGPIFRFSDTWQLVINTGTTIVTFLMVFLIQSTQNRDTAAIHIKLDELIRAIKGAENALCDLEELGETELLAAREKYHRLAEEARELTQRRQGRTAEKAANKPGLKP
jgi:low affinity Fe/Cu permease